MSDVVNKPPHYNKGDIECINAIEASMTKEEFSGYLKGNVLKYIWRYNNKGKPKEDLKKAKWYLERLIENYE
jgi:Ribonuclease G/E